MKGIKKMSKKVRKNYRFSENTVGEMATLIAFLSAEKHIQLDETKLLEMLVSERYSKLLKDLEG